MREILFRGKRVDNGEWAESQYPYGTMSEGVVQHDFISETIGQFTGLTDKNGVKIFEGDIVLWKKQVYAVKYFKSAFEFAIDPDDDFFVCGFSMHSKYKVIGNIYDNPELIEDMDLKPAAKRGDTPAEQLGLAPAT